MRIVNFFDAAQSETVPTIGSLVASNLIVYANDAAYEGGEPGGAVDGSIFYSSDLDAVRVYVNGAWASIVTQADIDAILSRLDTVETDIATLQTDLGTLETNAIQKDGSVTMEADLNIGENAVRRVSMITDVDDVDSVDPGNRQLISGGSPKLSWGNPGELDAHTSKVINVVDPTDPQDAATKAYVDSVAGAGVSVLNDLTDVDTTGVEDGQALVYDSDSSTWVPGEATGGSGTGGKNYFDAKSSDFEKGTIGNWRAESFLNTTPYNITTIDPAGDTALTSSLGFSLGTLVNQKVTSIAIDLFWVISTGTRDAVIELRETSSIGPVVATINVPGSSLAVGRTLPKTYAFPDNLPFLNGTYWIVFGQTPGTSNIATPTATGAGDRTFTVNATQRTTSTDLTLTANTVNPLAGAVDFSLAKAAVNAQNHAAVLDTQTIDRADRGKAFFGSFSYDASDANYASNDLRLEAYDVTNDRNLYMGPADSLLILKGQGKFDFVVYTEPTTEQIEFRIRVNSTNATAYTVFFDEFRLGPAASVNAVYRNEAVINLAGSGSFTGGSIRVSRVGGLISISTRTDLTFASTPAPTSAVGVIPAWARPFDTVWNMFFDLGGSPGERREIQVTNTGQISFRFFNESGSAVSRTSTGLYSISYNVEDTSSQVLTTNELGVQTGAFRASRNGTNQTGVNPNNSAVKINFNSVSGPYDRVSGLTYDTVNSRFVNEGPSGWFHFDATISVAATNVLNARYRAQLHLSSIGGTVGQTIVAATGITFTVSVSASIFVPTGDNVEVRLFGAADNSVNTLTVDGGAGITYFSGRRLPDFTVLGAVRERNKVQTKILASNVTTNGTIAALTFNNLVVGKWYECNLQARLEVNAGAADIRTQIIANHNSVNVGSVDFQNRQASSTGGDILTAGTTFKFRAEATTLVFDLTSASANSFLTGTGSRAATFVQLEERNDLMETTDFT